jgi:hypothetical protein
MNYMPTYVCNHSISSAGRCYELSDHVAGPIIVVPSPYTVSHTFIPRGNWDILVFHDLVSTNNDRSV